MTPETPEALRVALQVIDGLEDVGVANHLGGSYASSLHGVPRQTQAIDLVVDLGEDVVPELISGLEDDYHFDQVTIRRALRSKSSFNILHLKSGIKVDLFVRGDEAFDRQEFARHRQELIQVDPERRVFVKTPEDLVLRKLQWYRLGGEVSDRQWTDVLSVLAKPGPNGPLS